MQLSDLKVGDRAQIIQYNGQTSSFRRRLLSMGLLPGVVFRVSQIAPLGDPIEIRIKGYALSLRKFEADFLEIEVLST